FRYPPNSSRSVLINSPTVVRSPVLPRRGRRRAAPSSKWRGLSAIRPEQLQSPLFAQLGTRLVVIGTAIRIEAVAGLVIDEHLHVGMQAFDLVDGFHRNAVILASEM